MSFQEKAWSTALPARVADNRSTTSGLPDQILVDEVLSCGVS